MMTSITSVISCFVLYYLITSDFIFAIHWDYGDEKHWPPTCQNGKMQSPISLSWHEAIEKTEFPPLNFSLYYAQRAGVLQNNGHTVALNLNGQAPKVNGGGLEGAYIFDHLHFHWESEHVIGHRYPLEMHLVHYSDKFTGLAEALKENLGVAVFAVLFEISPDDNWSMQPITKLVSLLSEPGKSGGVDIRLADLMPNDVAGYFRYEGSLTTPNCTEEILWTVFTNTVPISQHQVDIFKDIKTVSGKRLKQNFRPLQKINGRKVYIKVSPIGSKSDADIASSGIMMVTAGVMFLLCDAL